MSTKPEQLGGGSIRIANKAQCAEFFGVSLPSIEAWIRKGMPVQARGAKGISWEIDLLEACKWRFAGQSSGGDVDPDSLDPVQRRAWYEGEVKKRDLQVKDRELIPVAEVERVVATAFAALASDIRAIPDNLERRHGVAGDVAESVEEALNEAMDALADRLSKLAPIAEEVAE
jgi:phage terminase Nu1 subunit (DNA packaging protein)